MKRFLRVSLLAFAAALLVASGVPAQDALSLLPARGGDLAAATLVPLAMEGAPVAERAPVTFSHALPADKPLDSAPTPFVSTSKAYWVDVTAAELARGVPLYTTSAAALVRINPAAGVASNAADRIAIEPASLTIATPDRRLLADGAAMELLVSADELAAAGTPFVAGTSAFRLRPDLGHGRFVLRAPGLLAPPASRYVVHVFEPKSDAVLALQTGAPSYLHGQTLTVDASLAGGAAVDEISAFVLSPAGRSWPLTFQAVGGDTYRASLRLDAVEAPTPGLWEVHTKVTGHQGANALLRTGRAAFACAVPTARLSGSASLTRAGRGGLPAAASIGVEVASAGRYEVRGVLYGTDATGTLRPLAATHAAAWLEPGSGVLALPLDGELIRASGLGAPFEVRDLQLLDQGRLGVLHRQARGFVIEK